MAERHKRVTLGADRGYDTSEFVDKIRDLQITPHVAQNTNNWFSVPDGKTLQQRAG